MAKALCVFKAKSYLYQMILVTGGTGLVGSHLLLHLLEKGESVRAIYRSKKKIAKVKSLFDYYSKGNLVEKINWIGVTKLPILNNIQHFIFFYAANIIIFYSNTGGMYQLRKKLKK